jgi:hypothetical protein
MPGCRVERVTRDGPASLHVAARSLGGVGRCPGCGRASRAVHSRYRRRPTDLPSLGRTVRVGLHVRRFYCRNAACPRRTFAERLPELVAPHARRTRRLAEAQARVGAALGGEASARLLPRLAMPASADTGTAAGPPDASAGAAGPAAGGRRGRLGGAQGAHVRHHPGGPGATPRAGPAPRPDRGDAGRLAAVPAGDRGGRPRPLDRVRARHPPGRAGGDPGRRPLAPADQRAADARAVAGRGARAAAAPAA